MDNATGIQSRIPPGTAAFIAIVVFVAAVQKLHPEWVALAGRDPARLAAGEWWRVVTALFAYGGGAVQTLSVVFGALALGIIAERKLGSVEWLIVAFASGLAGQIVGLWWQPVGAGASVAVAGMLGATATWFAWPGAPVPWFARIGSLVVLALAIALIALRDLHGPPIVVGAALAALFLRRSA